ncbi:uncharacterized protein EV422DRAFT_356590 [Fimicolochytrium jonesii]|uniref:uncharacterized protein n=1 Tax=Fimicolochytrium jonesii TaxID=1396493 RepID=UPI0022FEABBB|nr:uncharacterized protein EV422DRAFT_356590 [Fimicolochytrium jonesii]KAI8823464.1 hypothetical protein EV422DRAFT_356590 [Fimicolochytrium jonesii]
MTDTIRQAPAVLEANQPGAQLEGQGSCEPITPSYSPKSRAYTPTDFNHTGHLMDEKTIGAILERLNASARAQVSRMRDETDPAGKQTTAGGKTYAQAVENGTRTSPGSSASADSTSIVPTIRKELVTPHEAAAKSTDDGLLRIKVEPMDVDIAESDQVPHQAASRELRGRQHSVRDARASRERTTSPSIDSSAPWSSSTVSPGKSQSSPRRESSCVSVPFAANQKTQSKEPSATSPIYPPGLEPAHLTLPNGDKSSWKPGPIPIVDVALETHRAVMRRMRYDRKSEESELAIVDRQKAEIEKDIERLKEDIKVLREQLDKKEAALARKQGGIHEMNGIRKYVELRVEISDKEYESALAYEKLLMERPFGPDRLKPLEKPDQTPVSAPSAPAVDAPKAASHLPQKEKQSAVTPASRRIPLRKTSDASTEERARTSPASVEPPRTELAGAAEKQHAVVPHAAAIPNKRARSPDNDRDVRVERRPSTVPPAGYDPRVGPFSHSRQGSGPSNICYDYNRSECRSQGCTFRHLCVACGGHHPFHACNNKRTSCFRFNNEECGQQCHREHRCLRCAAGDHRWLDCDIPPPSEPGIEYCLTWNSSRNCHSGPTCERRHQCLRCLGNHAVIVCPENVGNYFDTIDGRYLAGGMQPVGPTPPVPMNMMGGAMHMMPGPQINGMPMMPLSQWDMPLPPPPFPLGAASAGRDDYKPKRMRMG